MLCVGGVVHSSSESWITRLSRRVLGRETTGPGLASSSESSSSSSSIFIGECRLSGLGVHLIGAEGASGDASFDGDLVGERLVPGGSVVVGPGLLRSSDSEHMGSLLSFQEGNFRFLDDFGVVRMSDSIEVSPTISKISGNSSSKGSISGSGWWIWLISPLFRFFPLGPEDGSGRLAWPAPHIVASSSNVNALESEDSRSSEPVRSTVSQSPPSARFCPRGTSRWGLRWGEAFLCAGAPVPGVLREAA